MVTVFTHSTQAQHAGHHTRKRTGTGNDCRAQAAYKCWPWVYEGRGLQAALHNVWEYPPAPQFSHSQPPSPSSHTYQQCNTGAALYRDRSQTLPCTRVCNIRLQKCTPTAAPWRAHPHHSAPQRITAQHSARTTTAGTAWPPIISVQAPLNSSTTPHNHAWNRQ